MKLAEHNNKLQTNAKFESQEFGIGDASVVIEILRNRLYKHPIRTLVQEYICNGRDAMREVGSKQDIQITVPNRLNPVFKVRDFGPGISPDRIKDVFVMYGASTKRDTNNQTGGFGIGAKSAWSYTDSFTIVTHIDGTKRTYVAHTGANNNGRLDHIGTDRTEETNGTEIQIAVKPNDLVSFKNAVARTVYFWDGGYVLKGVTDAELLQRPKSASVVDGLEVVDKGSFPDFITTNNYYNATPIAVIDGVVYKIESELSDLLNGIKELVQGQLVLSIPTGLLDVSASREELADSETTRNALKALNDKFVSQIGIYIKAEFKKAKSIQEYSETYRFLNGKFNLPPIYSKFQDYTFNGPKILSHDDFKDWKIIKSYVTRDKLVKMDAFKPGRYNATKVPQIDLSALDSYYLVDNTESKVKQNKRIRSILQTQQYIYTIESKLDGSTPKSKTIKDLSIQSINIIKLVELPKIVSPKIVREKASFCIRRIDEYNHKKPIHTTLADNDKVWHYIPMDKSVLVGVLDEDAKEMSKYGLNVCGLSQQALKHVAGNANFKPLTDWLANYKPTTECINYAKYMSKKNQRPIETLEQVGTTDDSFLNAMVQEYKTIKNNHWLPQVLFKIADETNEVKDFKVCDAKLTKTLDENYSLVHSVGYIGKKEGQELKAYINAKKGAKND